MGKVSRITWQLNICTCQCVTLPAGLASLHHCTVQSVPRAHRLIIYLDRKRWGGNASSVRVESTLDHISLYGHAGGCLSWTLFDVPFSTNFLDVLCIQRFGFVLYDLLYHDCHTVHAVQGLPYNTTGTVQYILNCTLTTNRRTRPTKNLLFDSGICKEKPVVKKFRYKWWIVLA